MKKIKFLTMSLLALLMACFTACNNDSIPMDYSEYIVGTWTAHLVNYAEALVFNADGTMQTYLVGSGDTSMVLSYYMEDHGTYTVKGNKLTMVWSDGTKYDITISMSPYKLLGFDYDGNGIDFDYDYCEEDLADEVVGMWVCTYVSTNNEDFNVYQDAEMAINTYKADGKSIFTGFVVEANDYMANVESTYKVIGDLMLESNPLGEGVFQYNAFRLTYSPNSNQLGDMLTKTSVMAFGDEVIEFNASMVRVKETLDLAGKTYNYHDVYVSNVDGVDKEINILGDSFNFAKMDGSELDIKLKSTLFKVEFPKADTIKYTCRHSSELEVSVEAPIAVEGNKLTIKMSEVYPSCKDVVLYTFQDADNSQMHMYMPTTSFINFFGNMQVTMMAQLGQLDLNDAAAVKTIYDNIDAAVNTINVSLVFKAK